MKAKYIFAGALAAVLACGCSDQIIHSSGEGSITLSASVNSDMKVESRSLADDLASTTTIWIAKKSETNALVREYKGMENVPTSPIPLLSGSYMARGWAGDSVTATFDNAQRFFKGEVDFAVNDAQTTRVELPLKIANVGVSVRYSDAVADVLTDCSMTVANTRGSLEFTGETAASRGYFMMPQNDSKLTFTLTGTQADGSAFTKSGEILDPKGGTEYIINVVYNGSADTMGGAYFTIEIDTNEMTSDENITIVSAPSITGYGFNIANPVNAESGAVGRRTVYIGSATHITDIELNSDELTAMIGGSDVNLLQMTDGVKANLENAGINFTVKENTDDAGQFVSTLVQINFEEQYTDALANGRYSFAIKATDDKGHVSNATLEFNISSDPVAIVAPVMSDYSAYSATLRGRVLMADAANPGFNYRAKTASRSGGDWTFVAGVVEGSEMTAHVTGLTPGTEYEYVVVADGFTGEKVQSFTTEVAEQLPNAGFEEWSLMSDDKTWLLCADESTMYWDSGNHGATTMGGSITTPDETMKHSGTYCAKLESAFKGVGIIGKFAAGNLFAGRYLATDGTDGVLGWGRPFSSRPTAMKCWVKYEPKTAVNRKGAVNGYIAEGQLDQGIIYLALTDETTMDAEYSGTINGDQRAWPQVVKTKSKQLFSKNDAKVIAYGEHVFTEATAGSGLIEVTIPLDYFRQNVRPSNLILVVSASRYGDYFSGGEGSTMYIDDIELVYE